MKYTAAQKWSSQVASLVARAQGALAEAARLLPEEQRAEALAIAESRPRVPANFVAHLPRGAFTHQERMVDEARAAGCARELISVLVREPSVCTLRIALDHELPSARVWAVSMAALNAWSMVSTATSARWLLSMHGESQSWDAEASSLVSQWLREAENYAESILSLCEMVR